MFYALLTLVALSGEVITTEHYAAPYPTLQACIVQANIMAGQKDYGGGHLFFGVWFVTEVVFDCYSH